MFVATCPLRASAVVTLLAALLFVARAREFYIATDGDDAHPGTVDKPVATFQRARDVVRAWRAATPTTEPVTIFVRQGRYQFDAPLELTEMDSGTRDAPVVWRPFNSEVIEVSGGRRLTGFRRVTDPAVLALWTEAARAHVRVTDLRAAGVADFGEAATAGYFGDTVAAGRSPELFHGGRPMPLARWPNEGFVAVGAVSGGRPVEDNGFTWGDGTGEFGYEDPRPERWAAEPDAWVHGYWYHDWADGRQKVRAIDREARTIALAPPQHHYGYREGQRYYAFNLLSELDSPGEWYLDRRTGLLYFWPPAESSSTATSNTTTSATGKGGGGTQRSARARCVRELRRGGPEAALVLKALGRRLHMLAHEFDKSLENGPMSPTARAEHTHTQAEVAKHKNTAPESGRPPPFPQVPQVTRRTDACKRSMPQHPFLELHIGVWKHAAASNVLSSCVCLPAPALFARETFCLPHVSPVCFYLSCHESVICTNNIQSTVQLDVINSAQQCCACCLLFVSPISHRCVGTHMCR